MRRDLMTPLVKPLLLAGMLVAGCTSTNGPAPVEHRDIFMPAPAVVLEPGPAQVAPVAVAPPLVSPRTPSAATEAVATSPVRSGQVDVRPLDTPEQPAVSAPAPVAMAPSGTPPAGPASPSAVDPKPPIATNVPGKAPVIGNQPTTGNQPAAKPAPEPVAKEPAAVPEKLASVAPFIWPASGSLVQSFSDAKSMGIGISGRAGDPISAAADGKVIFSGLGPRGYGKLLIVKHTGELLSVYAHNQNLLVKEGQAVRQGQKIAELGSTGTDRPKLHFEIRRQGKPVDPMAFLPQQR